MFRIIVRFRGCRICWNCIIQVSSHTPNKIWQIMSWETGTRLRLWPLAFGSLQIANMSHIIAVDGRNQCWFQLRFTPSHPKYYRPSEKKKTKSEQISQSIQGMATKLYTWNWNTKTYMMYWRIDLITSSSTYSANKHLLLCSFGSENWQSKLFRMAHHKHNTFFVRLFGWYYHWWTKSCNTKDDDYLIIYRVLLIPGGWPDFFHQQYLSPVSYLPWGVSAIFFSKDKSWSVH